MITTLLLLSLSASPPRAPEPAHAPEEAALLKAAFPEHDQATGFLGHSEGILVERSSACADARACYLAVTAKDPAAAGVEGGHAWTTFFAFRLVDGSWVEAGHAAGPVVSASGRWQLSVSTRVEKDGPFITVTSVSSSADEGEGSATHLWSWDGKKFLPVLTATTGKQGGMEIETSFVACGDRPEDHPSWELRGREREGRGKWTETRSRVLWNGQAWVERPADKACSERPVVASAAAASPASVAQATVASTLRVKSASASRANPGPKARPKAWAAASAIDGDRQTAWIPGGKKGGVGEWLQLDFAAPTVLGSLKLIATCPGGDWKASPRVKKVKIRFADGPAQEETLADVQSSQSIIVKRKEPARWVRVELVELYKGSKWVDACLTDVVAQAR
jgi:hypothetical protein